MKNLLKRLEAIQHGGPQLVTALLAIGGAAALLLVIAVIGLFTVGGDAGGGSSKLATGSTGSTESTATTVGSLDSVAPGSGETTVPGAAPTTPGATPGKGTATTTKGTKTTTAAGGGGSTTPVTEAPPAAGEAALPKGGSTVGVTAQSIKYGVHAPITFNKAPVPLAGPVVRGVKTFVQFLNDNGGINGRKIDLQVVDDEFTPEGAKNAANTLINDQKVFFISGTLGVDQIQVVADQSNRAKVPYFAGGGNEPQFKDLNVHQILSSYDTHVIKLAQFMGKDDMYKGKKVGVIVSDTPLINPAVTNIFKAELEKNGLSLVAVEKVQKPEVQSAQGYAGITLNFKSKNVQVVVPLTDPINTSGLVRQCQTEGGCPWTYSFSDFAHDGETALTLFADTWGQQKVRGLSGACYANAPDAQLNDTAKCGSMGKAKAQFETVKGKGAWTASQSDGDGTSAGYNSGAGYQLVGFWTKAMRDLGTEVTRERLIASANRYDGYNDLITGPITYKNVNIAHGAEKMTVLEAQTGQKYKMISDGFVDGF